MLESIRFIVEQLTPQGWFGIINDDGYLYETTHYQAGLAMARIKALEQPGELYRVVQVSRYIHATVKINKETS